MNRKQNSLMRFSRTERLAQLSEQESVIEKKKREIQAKLEAQKKKETEEAFKKLEFSKESKSTKPGFPRKSWSGNEFKKNNDREKPPEKVKEGLTNAFSNDGTFLDQFKKLSQSGLSSNYEMHAPAAENKGEGDLKDSSDFSEECSKAKYTNRKRESENDRDCSESLEKTKKTNWDKKQSSFIRNSSESGIQLQPPKVFQFPQHQSVSVLSAVNNSKSTVPMLPNQVSQTQSSTQLNECFSDNKQLSNQSNYFNIMQSVQPIQHPDLCQSNNTNSFLLNTVQPPAATPNIPQPSPVMSSSVPTSELPKIRSESISMTLKTNTVKKLEAIPNPLEMDQEPSPDSLKKNPFSFPEKESSKDTFLNASQNYRSTSNVENVSSHDKDSSRISSAFCNEGDDNDGDDEEENEDGGQLNDKLKHWAGLVARCGDEFEDSLRSRNENDPDLRFLTNKNSKEYMLYRKLVLKYRLRLKPSEEEPSEKSSKTYETINEDSYKVKGYLGSETMLTDVQQTKKFSTSIGQADVEHNNVSDSTFKDHCFSHSQKQYLSKETSSQIPKEENNVEGCDEQKIEERRKRKRKSRWGDAEPTTSTPGIEPNLDLQPPGKLPVPKSALLSQLTRSDPGLIQYARQTFGSTNLSEEDWKKAEDHYKINLLYQDMIKKRAEVEKLERQGKFKYEYDSDEDTEGGTWEHKLRQQEMQATQLWAEELTRQAAGKHHIGDFLPPEELERFMEKYNAVKEGREPDLSDYKEYKLKEDNVGYRLLQKMGWNEGQGLGQDGSGITNPVNKGATRHENQGLGVERPDGLEPGDDEYDAYRKRMMLAYRFRPNPLNNPRRPYY